MRSSTLSLRTALSTGMCITTLATALLACSPNPDEGATEAAIEPAAGEPAAAEPAELSRPFYLGGIQVHEADHAAWFANLERQGMNTVQVTDYAMQGDWDSDHMWWDEEEPWVIEEIRGAKRAGLSVVLVLRVALDHAFERNAFLWHGMIMPNSDELLASWFEQYTRFCRKWAEVAEREGVDVLMLGSEMNALASTLPAEDVPALEEYYLNEEKQERRREEVLARRQLIENTQLSLREKESFDSVEEYLEARIAKEQAWARTMLGPSGKSAAGGSGASDGTTSPSSGGSDDPALSAETLNARRAELQRHWQALIGELRDVYRGPLGYAANFDQYHEVGFWPELDVMGINAYFKLRHKVLDAFEPDTLYPLLLDGWRSVLGDIAAFRRDQNLQDMPVIFTELGYTWRRRSTLEPWADTGFAVIEEPVPAAEGDAEAPAPIKHVVVWREEPRQLEERALAVRALHQAHRELDEPFLRGLLYWKLSSHDYHYDDESFMLHVGADSEDPMLPELRRFVESAATAAPK